MLGKFVLKYVSMFGIAFVVNIILGYLNFPGAFILAMSIFSCVAFGIIWDNANEDRYGD